MSLKYPQSEDSEVYIYFIYLQPPLYDFYHDSNVSQAVQSKIPLEQLEKKINEVLQQWPEHPTLLEVSLNPTQEVFVYNVCICGKTARNVH